MKKFLSIILLTFTFSLLQGCCKYTVTEKELHIHFSNDYSPADSVTISYSTPYNNSLESENIKIGENRLIILNQYSNSHFNSVDTMIIQVKSKNIIDTLTNFKFSSKEKDLIGCAAADTELFSFEKDSVIYTPANIIQIDY